MKPFAEWTRNEDAVNLPLAQQMATARWPNDAVTVESTDFGYSIIATFTAPDGAKSRIGWRLTAMSATPPNFPAGWEPPADWSAEAIHEALEGIAHA